MVTVKEVAQAASVSPATVSRVLNNTSYVSEDIRKRVLEAVSDLGYTPNASARSLKSRVTETVGLLLSDVNSQFFATIVQGVLQVATRFGYHLILCTSEDDPVQEEENLRLLIKKGVDGIVLMPTGGNRHTLREIKRRNIRVVQVDRVVGELSESDAVLVDNTKGACDATRYLLSLGHERIGMICGPQHVSTGRERLQGYRKALEEAGLQMSPELVKFGPFSRETGYNATKELLNGEHTVTAIFTTSNHFEVGTMQALRDLNVRIPDDISVIGWDDEHWASFTTPRLTVVSQPAFTLGTTAMQLLLQRMKGDQEGDSPVITRFEAALVVRESCSPPANRAVTPAASRQLDLA